MKRMICGVLVLGLAALVATGCGDRRMLRVEYVEGVVTVDGQPVAEATVTFVPVTESEGMSAYGMTNEQGVYRLTAVGSGEEKAPSEGGTVPGEYYVGVTKSIAEIEGFTEEELDRLLEIPMTYVVPRRYNRPQESGIRETVERGKNTINIELSSK